MLHADNMSSYLAAVLLSLVPPPGLASPVTCSSPGLQCGVAGPSLLAAVPRVAGLQQCRALCRDRDQCRYLAYHDQAAAPASHFCLLFTSCDTVTPCSHCVSERRDCLMDTCGSSIVGDLDENVLSSIPNTESEMECKALCANNIECAFYTYFLPADSLYPRICFLQTELAPPVQPCPTAPPPPRAQRHGDPGHHGHGLGALHGQHAAGGRGRPGGREFLSVRLEPGTKLRAEVGDQRQASSVTFSGASLAQGQGYGGGGNGYSEFADGLQGVVLVEATSEFK